MQRAYDQVIHDVAIQKLNVIFCLDRAGLVGDDGPTHHGSFDLAYFRCIPNMIISAPINEHELRNLMYSAQKEPNGPYVIRYPRGRGVMQDWKSKFEYIRPGGNGGGSTATGNFGVTLGLATITFFAIIIAGVKKHGFIGHWKNMVPSGVPAPVLIILIPIEIIGMFVKPFALIMRLGANMTAGHIGMVAIFALPIILGNGIAGISDPSVFNYPIGFLAGFIAVLLNTAIYGLEIIVSLVQAYVFTLLSCVFIGMAIHADH